MTAEYTLGLKSKDIIGPSPNTYVYIYEGKEHFYIPDFYIPDLNLEIEIKDGGDDPNKHPHMQVDRAKEKLKDEMMIKNPSVNYFKVVDKKYDDFYKFLLDCKLAIDDTTKDKISQLIMANESVYSIMDVALESGIYDVSFKDPKEVYDTITKRVKYAEFTKLMTADQVFRECKGSCHDQARLAEAFLKHADVSPKLNFFIAYREGDDVGGDTHTFVTYKDGDSICWFETSWQGECGIHKYPNMSSLQEDIKKRHLKTSNGKKYPELEFRSSPAHELKPGMNLNQYVNAWLGEAANESIFFSGKDEYFNIDKWVRGKGTNILYITGLPGSGKSTLGQELANKYGATFIELDRIVEGEPSVGKWDPDKNFESDRIISMIYGHDELIITEEDSRFSVGIKRKRAIDLLYDYCIKRPNTLYIWEGIWIYESFSKEYFTDKPLIIKGTSRETSMRRELVRDEFVPNITQRANHKIFYKNSENNLNTLRKYMRQNAEATPALESVKCDIPTIIPKQMFKRDFLNIPDSSLLHLTRDEYIKRCSKDPNFGKDSEFYGFYNEYDEIMGITCVTDMGSSKCIDLIVVDDKYRRHGLGTYITNFACKQLHGDWLIVRDSNKAALSIYKKYGFKEATRYEGRVFMTAPNSSKKIEFDNYIEEHYSPATEQDHFDILVDKLDPNHKQKGKKSLSQFKRQPLTKELVKKFKGQGKLITDGFRYQDPKHPEDTCVVWTDGDKFVGAIAYDTYPDKQGYKWITALDVGYDYKSYGLGEQIVKYAMSQGANALAVQYDNEIALRLYKKLGFKTSKISEEDVKAGRNASYNLYLDPSHAVESALKASERTDFGLPDIKKYPMPDEKHVLLAIQYFNYVEEDRERELADNILKRMSELNIKCVNVGEKNRFAKYYKPTEDSVMTSWCASEPGMGIVAMESGHGDDFYTPIRLNTKQWCNYRGQKYYPLYIVLLKNMDALGRVIQTYTKEPYSHSLISFDPSMNDLYTFGHKLMKKGDKEHMDFGTAHETFNPKTGRFHYPLNTQYEIFVMFFNEKQIKAVRKTIDNIFTNHEKYKYNIAGLIQYIFKIPRTNPQKLFCSQFVSMVLNSGKPDLLDRDPSMYTPSNLMTLRGIFSVDSGVMKDYDSTVVEKKTKQIFDRIIESGDTTALEHINLLYNVDWEDSDSIEVYGGYTYPES